jgi:anti-anti-sigma regulatory factor
MSAEFEVLDGGTSFELRERGATIWVALYGVLDAQRWEQLESRLSPLLTRRGRRVVLDGRRLFHLDYRAVRPLLVWHRTLRPFGHQLVLAGWSAYLKAILCLEDWSQELANGCVPLPAGATGGAAQFDAAP